jgi:predicted nucleic acid-binding Zn ribbon protein
MRTCVICGVMIEHRHPNAKTCSKRCYDDLDNERGRIARSAKWRGRRCAICEKSLDGTPYQTKTCSDECRRQYGLKYHRDYYSNFGRKTQSEEARKEYMREYTRRNADQLRAKKSAYRQANRERLRQAEKDRLSRDGDIIRARARQRHEARRAALMLIREIETKGLEALL